MYFSINFKHFKGTLFFNSHSHTPPLGTLKKCTQQWASHGTSAAYFYVEFTDSAEWVWSGKNGQVQHLKLPYALEEMNREKKKKTLKTFEQCGFLNVTGLYVAKPHTLSNHFMEWQEMTIGCTLQFKPSPVERRIPKQRKCWRTFPSEQVSSSSMQGQQKTKLPIFPYAT